MTSLTQRFIKTAFGFLILGLLLGGWMLLRRELFGEWPHAYLISAHTHVMFLGFVMFMILGVALWLFPKPSPTDTRYRESRIELVYWLMLTGTLLRVAGELWHSQSEAIYPAWLVVSGGLVQLIAIMLYIWTMWQRIRSTTGYKHRKVTREDVHNTSSHEL